MLTNLDVPQLVLYSVESIDDWSFVLPSWLAPGDLRDPSSGSLGLCLGIDTLVASTSQMPQSMFGAGLGLFAGCFGFYFLNGQSPRRGLVMQ